jgi:putative ABC transport system permease protein
VGTREALFWPHIAIRLAWRNLVFDRIRFCVTLVGIAFSVFLMVFQGSLLAGFIRAASRVIDASDGEFWIAARGVPCFECATPVPSRFREIAMGTEGVASVQRVVAGAAVWKKASGKGQIVYIIGAEPGIGPEFPLPYLSDRSGPMQPERVLLDRSNAEMLEVRGTGVEVEINRKRALVWGTVDDFGSFIGQPYTFTNYTDALRYLGGRPSEAQFLVVHVTPGSNLEKIKRDLQTRLPDVNVHTRAQFSRSARSYWTTLTGAGSAILTAALLGFIVGTVIVSQTIYANTMENLEEFATLKSMGAGRFYIERVVLLQAWISGVIGSAAGIAVTLALVSVIRHSIPWVYMPSWLSTAMVAISLLMCTLASLISVRKAVTVEPARVFRA